MTTSPNRISQKLELVETAWAELAPNAEFAGFSLETFRDATKPSRDERATIDSLDRLRSGAVARRTLADQATLDAIELVVNAVRGTKSYGANSDLYRAMGYVPKAERKSGLTFKAKAAQRETQAAV